MLYSRGSGMKKWEQRKHMHIKIPADYHRHEKNIGDKRQDTKPAFDPVALVVDNSAAAEHNPYFL